MKVHPTFPTLRKIICFPSAFVLTIEAQPKGLQPSQSVALILSCTLLGYNILDNDKAITEKIIPPITGFSPLMTLILNMRFGVAGRNNLWSVRSGGGHIEQLEIF